LADRILAEMDNEFLRRQRLDQTARNDLACQLITFSAIQFITDRHGGSVNPVAAIQS